MSQGMGRVLARRRGGVSPRAWRRAVVVAVDLWLVVAVVRTLVAGREHFVRDALVLLLVVGAVVLALLLAAVWSARRRVHEVCEAGLVLRRPGSPDVHLPWEDLDPGRVVLSEPARSAPTLVPWRWVRWAVTPAVVLVNGREGSDAPFAWWELPAADPVHLLTAIESAMIAAEHPARGLTAAAIDHRQPAGEPTQRVLTQLDRGPGDGPIGVDAG